MEGSFLELSYELGKVGNDPLHFTSAKNWNNLLPSRVSWLCAIITFPLVVEFRKHKVVLPIQDSPEVVITALTFAYFES